MTDILGPRSDVQLRTRRDAFVGQLSRTVVARIPPGALPPFGPQLPLVERNHLARSSLADTDQ